MRLSCRSCQESCRTIPGWFTPEEAMVGVAAGYAPRKEAGPVFRREVLWINPACSAALDRESREHQFTLLEEASPCRP